MYKQIASILFSTLIVSASSIHGMKRSSAYDIEELRETRVPSMNYPNAIQLPSMDYYEFSPHNKKPRIEKTTDFLENETIYHMYSSEIQQTEPRGFHIPEESEKVKLSRKKTVSKEKKAPKKRTKPERPAYVKQVYPCEIEGCMYQAPNGEQLEVHKRRHKSEIYSVCLICHFRAESKSKYDRHMLTHSGVSERGFQCSFCNKHLSCGDRLQSHILICKENSDKMATKKSSGK